MKGLILKDLYSVRFQIIVGAIIGLYPNTLIVIGWTDILGDLSPNMIDISATILHIMVNIATILPFSSLMVNTITDDAESGWTKICRTMPVTSSQLITSKILSTVMITGIFTLISLIFNIISIIRGVPVIAEAVVAFPLCMGVIQLLALIPVFPLSLKLGAKSANKIYLAFVIIFSFAAIILAFAAFSDELPPYALRIGAYAVLPVLTVITLLISYKSGKNLIARDM